MNEKELDLVKELVDNNATVWFTVSGTSMRPLIDAGDRVLVGKADVSDLSVCDIMTFYEHGSFVTHRVVGKYRIGRRLTLIEKGDRSSKVGKVDAGSVLGKVIAVKHKDGRVSGMDDLERAKKGPRVYLLLGLSVLDSVLHRIKDKMSKGVPLGVRRVHLSVWTWAARGLSKEEKHA